METQYSNTELKIRDAAKSLFLKKKFNFLSVLKWEYLEQEVLNFDIIINATSVGLNKDDKISLDFSKVGQNKLYYDVIYNPKETNFLKTAKKQENNIENGKMMFIYQASAAFKTWHGVEPEIDSEVIKFLTDD